MSAIRAGGYLRRCRRVLGVFALFAMTQSLLLGSAAGKDDRLAYSIEIAGDIDQSTVRDLNFALDDARRRGASMLIIRLDTPGGLADSMRTMVRAIAAAPIPVIVYVYPSAARADSAGLPLTLAADVAAMAPQTNIGSATPIWNGPPPRTRSEDQRLQDLRRKAINGGAAFVRALAEDHGRNADLAERMVRKAENTTAMQAHRQKLIDMLAPTEQALVRSLDGFVVKGRKAQRLDTSDLRIKHFDGRPLGVGSGEDYDNWSSLRSSAYLIGGVATVALVLVGMTRGRPAWRRWRRRRRWLKRRRG